MQRASTTRRPGSFSLHGTSSSTPGPCWHRHVLYHQFCTVTRPTFTSSLTTFLGVVCLVPEVTLQSCRISYPPRKIHLQCRAGQVKSTQSCILRFQARPGAVLQYCVCVMCHVANDFLIDLGSARTCLTLSRGLRSQCATP